MKPSAETIVSAQQDFNMTCPRCGQLLVAYPRGDFLCHCCGASFNVLELQDSPVPEIAVPEEDLDYGDLP